MSFATGMNFVRNIDNIIYSDYFKSPGFESYIFNYLGQVKSFYQDYKDFEKKTKEEKLSKDELYSIKQRFEVGFKSESNKITEEYNIAINQAEQSGNKDKTNRLIEERDKKIESIKKDSDEKLQNDIEIKLSNKDKEYNRLKNYLGQGKDLKFYIEEAGNNEVYSNIDDGYNVEAYISRSAFYSVKIPLDENNLGDLKSVNSYFKTLQWNGYIIVPRPSNTYSNVLSNYNNYNNGKLQIIKRGIISLVLLVISVFLLIILNRRKHKSELFDRIKKMYKRIPLELRGILFLGDLVVLFITILLMATENLPSENLIFGGPVAAVSILFLGINLKGLRVIIMNSDEIIAEKKGSLLYKWAGLLQDSFIVKSALLKIVVIGVMTLIVMYFFASYFAGAVWRDEIIPMLLFIFAYFSIVPMYIFKKISLFNRIVKGTDEIVCGNLNYVIEAKGKGNITKLAQNINDMKYGIKKSVEAQMKSEKLKTELITNVSHDLKTPLTSIINYVDLLKNQELSKEEIHDYVAILERKAERLKLLIEDLFEASKMTSGAVELNLERVDIGALMNQALGEFDEKIKASSLSFKLNVPREKFYAQLDGKKTWRVFENLIGNILKYSQADTRVYIDLVQQGENIVLTMRNISAYEMDFEENEIFERFKRGDSSRHTEGSGLGLAIAKSIMELQGGKLSINIDGDLFKVVLEFDKFV
jgi:signal transduction histidine kinase